MGLYLHASDRFGCGTSSSILVRRGRAIGAWFTETIWNCNQDRKSTRLNSSHLVISYAVFCLKKKKNRTCITTGDVMYIAHRTQYHVTSLALHLCRYLLHFISTCYSLFLFFH